MLLELFGVVFGFIYLYLEIVQKKGMWLVGFLMAAVYAVVYWQQEVYASMCFQIYYVLVSIYGFLQWGNDKLKAGAGEARLQGVTESETSQIIYRKMPLKVLLLSILIYAAVVSFMVLVLGKYTDDPMPFADSSITVVSAIATFWLSKSYREQWLAWLVVNTFTVTMCLRIGLYPTAVLYFVNAVASIYGYLHWKRKGILIE
jgi:nicotinamide mononucleotide transporter